MRHAWLTVAIYAMARSKGQMPELESLLSAGRHERPHDDMVSKLHHLSALTGFPLRVVRGQTDTVQ